MMRDNGSESTLTIMKTFNKDYRISFEMCGLSFEEATAIGSVLNELSGKYGHKFEEVD